MRGAALLYHMWRDPTPQHSQETASTDHYGRGSSVSIILGLAAAPCGADERSIVHVCTQFCRKPERAWVDACNGRDPLLFIALCICGMH